MKEKKEIDRLFQERFKDYEAQPSPEVWAGIQDRLSKKQTKRVIPLWWKLGGIAAALVVLFVVGNLFFSPKDNLPQEKNQIVITEQENSESGVKKNSDSGTQDSLGSDVLVSTDSAGSTDDSQSEKQSSGRERGNAATTKSPEAIVSHETTVPNNSSDTDNQNREEQKSKVAEAASKTNKNDQNPVVAHSGNDQELSEDSSSIANTTKNKESLAQNPFKQNETHSESNLASYEPDTTKQSKEEASLLELAGLENTTDEDELSSKDDLPAKRWALTPNIAPVYYSSFSGSGIDSKFSGNDKKGEVNMSYGLLVSYDLNSKLTLRSGINRIGLSYNTDDVVVTTSLQAGALSSVNYASGSQVLSVSNNALNSAQEVANSNQDILEVPQRRNISTGSFNQSLAYYEIPMEVEYTLLEQKVGVHLIGGVSTLVLDDNEINLNQGDYTTFFGTSNSLNSLSFSTNIGVGLNYKFTDAIKFNLEPMFKYQLNAYKNSVSDFKPYYLGLYSGLSIKF